jgi:type VI secretion system secreted protein Hcp
MRRRSWETGAMAAIDFFLKLDAIKGESADAKHKDEIDIESWSWGETMAPKTGSGRGGGAGKVQMQDFHFVMRTNRAGPQLAKACATGQHIKLATLTVRKAGKGQQEYLVFKFHDLLISSYQTGGAEGTDGTTDSCSFNFAKMEMEYKPQKPDGSLGPAVNFKYDLKSNKAF